MNILNYWSIVFGGDSWQELLDHKPNVAGFPQLDRNVQAIEPGDHLLCYQSGVSRWIRALKVVSKVREDYTRIWRDGPYPQRVRVEVVLALTPETGVSIHQLRDQLMIYKKWPAFFRGYPRNIAETDGKVILKALQEAKNRTTE